MKKGLIIILCGLLILTAGCSKKDKVTKKTFETSLDMQFDAVKNMVEDEEVPEYLGELEARQSYKIVSFERDGNIADAVVLVKAPDFYTIVKEVDQMTELSKEEQQSVLAQKIKKGKMVETEVEMQFEYVDGKWSPILTGEFVDAYYGGILRLKSELYQEAVEGGEYLE